MQEDAVYLSAVDLVSRYRDGSLDPVAVTEAHLERIPSIDPKLNCYITVTAERALERARVSSERYRSGKPVSGVDGVPFAAKDIFATAGILTSHGSKLGRDNVPSENATAVQKLEDAGAVLLGKLNLLEFATGSGTESGYGPTRNPWNPEYEPGGSSSGSGAALTAKIGEPTRLLGKDVRWFEYGMVNLGNITGFPAATVPCGFDSRGLPVGLQIYGRPFEEDRVLAFAHGYERSTEWHRERPSL
jgi:Asp-tRNA(Asn)/Glu-tRNA(Gln) amidotransferase A subunit family amidase